VLEGVLALLLFAVLGLIVSIGLLYRRLWLLMGSVECLCNHISHTVQVPHDHAP
jgi:hypothetical protein